MLNKTCPHCAHSFPEDQRDRTKYCPKCLRWWIDPFGPLEPTPEVQNEVGYKIPLDAENPKKACGDVKANFWGVPSSALIWLGNVMGSGAYKYGAFNFRDTKIAASTYHDAIQRHLALYFDGEDLDPLETPEGEPPGSGAPHLAHVMACCALLMDAEEGGMLQDDRSKTGEVRGLLEKSKKALRASQAAYDAYEQEREDKETQDADFP